MKNIVKQGAAVGAGLVMTLFGVVGVPQSAYAISSCPTDLFGGETPGESNYNDTAAVNVGVKFKVHGAPFVTGAKFYKGVDNTGTHIAHLRAVGGSSDLASATFTSERGSGWQTVSFGSSVAVDPAQNYVVWVSMPNGHYAVDTYGANTFSNGIGTSQSAAYVPAGNNGVYGYTSSDSTVPTGTTNFNYWVSPVVSDSVAPGNVGSITTASSGAGPTVSWSSAANDTNSETSNGGSAYADVYRNDGSSSVRVGRTYGNLTTEWQDINGTALQHDVTAAPGASYTYTVKSTDYCGNVSTGTTSSSVTAPTAASAEHLFTSNPANVDSSTLPTVVGMHWQADSDGTVQGARIYRAAGTGHDLVRNANEGIVAKLWDNDGTVLATQRLPQGNNQSGWIDVRFDSPVSVSASHDYVIGYYSSNGQEAYTNNVFGSAVSNGSHLTARADSSTTANGVYAQSSSTTWTDFPNNRAPEGTWYGVDVNFAAQQ